MMGCFNFLPRLFDDHDCKELDRQFHVRERKRDKGSKTLVRRIP